MKIRLMGSPDLVRAWAAAISKAFGAQCAEYTCRGSKDIRAYCDIDDRQAAAIAFAADTPYGLAPLQLTETQAKKRNASRGKGKL